MSAININLLVCSVAQSPSPPLPPLPPPLLPVGFVVVARRPAVGCLLRLSLRRRRSKRAVSSRRALAGVFGSRFGLNASVEIPRVFCCHLSASAFAPSRTLSDAAVLLPLPPPRSFPVNDSGSTTTTAASLWIHARDAQGKKTRQRLARRDPDRAVAKETSKFMRFFASTATRDPGY